ncbi:hypothetical protein Tco_0484064 [Tanacetum coccineum]
MSLWRHGRKLLEIKKSLSLLIDARMSSSYSCCNQLLVTKGSSSCGYINDLSAVKDNVTLLRTSVKTQSPKLEMIDSLFKKVSDTEDDVPSLFMKVPSVLEKSIMDGWVDPSGEVTVTGYTEVLAWILFSYKRFLPCRTEKMINQLQLSLEIANPPILSDLSPVKDNIKLHSTNLATTDVQYTTHQEQGDDSHRCAYFTDFTGQSTVGTLAMIESLKKVGTLATIKSLRKPCIAGFMKPINFTPSPTPPLHHHSPPPTSSSMIVTPSTPKPNTTKPLYHRMPPLLKAIK